MDVESSKKACALVRVFKTHPYGELDPEAQGFARRMLGEQSGASATVKCLTLLATAGEKPEWNSRTQSVGHQAIPLASEQMVIQAPMISNLITQLGLSISTVLEPNSGLLLDKEQRTYNVFHVSEASGSSYIPAQEEFVIPFGIKSVLGFGGMLPSGNLFAVIMFSKVHIPRETAELFKPLALSAKVTLLPFDGGAVFA